MLPTAARTESAARTVVLLDASLSMELPTTGTATRWTEAVTRARRAGNTTVLLMGGPPRRIPLDSLGAVQPSFAESRLLPALQAAGEGGAEKVILITDGGIEDLAEVRRWLPRLGLELEVHGVGSTPQRDLGIAELVAPTWVEAGKPVNVQVGITGTLSGGQPATVTIRSAGAVLATTSVPAPQAGRIAPATLQFTAPAPPGGGTVRFDVALEPRDVIAANNSRTFYLQIGETPAGVALVSFKPDWEPRFLHPVLEQALGLPVRSFLRATGSQFIQGGSGVEAGKRATEAEVREAVTQADLLVVHGIGPDLPAWAREAVRSKSSVLIFPGELGVALGAGFDLPQATPGDWYISQTIPPSPVAGLLAGMPTENLPPLLGVVLPREAPTGGWVALQAMRGRRGVEAPAAIAVAEAGRRRVIALGLGFWRWAFRGGEQRQAYTRLWGALAGWLVQEQGQQTAGAVRPVARVVGQRARPAWVAPGLSADSIRVRILAGARTVADSTIPLEQGDTAVSSSLAPGHYRYDARAFAGGREVGSGSGPLTVDTYSDEYARVSHSLADLSGAADLGALRQNRGGARPLRTMIWPYLVIAALLATEWVLRRRWGLR